MKYKDICVTQGKIGRWRWRIQCAVNEKGDVVSRGIFIENMDHILELSKERYKTTCIGTIDKEGKQITIRGLHKREHKSVCETCSHHKERLAYHHWDDTNPSKGIWVCNKCHHLITSFEQKDFVLVIQNYLVLKNRLNKEMSPKADKKLISKLIAEEKE